MVIVKGTVIREIDCPELKCSHTRCGIVHQFTESCFFRFLVQISSHKLSYFRPNLFSGILQFFRILFKIRFRIASAHQDKAAHIHKIRWLFCHGKGIPVQSLYSVFRCHEIFFKEILYLLVLFPAGNIAFYSLSQFGKLLSMTPFPGVSEVLLIFCNGSLFFLHLLLNLGCKLFYSFALGLSQFGKLLSMTPFPGVPEVILIFYNGSLFFLHLLLNLGCNLFYSFALAIQCKCIRNCIGRCADIISFHDADKGSVADIHRSGQQSAQLFHTLYIYLIDISPVLVCENILSIDIYGI